MIIDVRALFERQMTFPNPDARARLNGLVGIDDNIDRLRNHWPLASNNGAANIPIHTRMLSNNSELLRNCAAADMGLVVGPSYALGDDIRSKRLVRLLADHFLGQMAVMMVYPSRRQMSAKVRSFIDFMTERHPHPDRDPWGEAG